MSEPLTRPLLRDMTPAERAGWYLEHRAELEEFCSYAQQYTKRRKRSGIETHTDVRYEQFFVVAADLIAGLDELHLEAKEQSLQERE